jgi:3'-phosphoadenosine 5'-phosphosulfate sulfotransferase (PAPS reductase)/FAD synthetase
MSLLVVAYGGGVNSSAMLVGMAESGIVPDLILFADTGGEKPETYESVALMSEWSECELGVPIRTVRASIKTDATLEDNCLRLGTLPSIVYGGRTCSQRWKLEPCEKFLNNWAPAREAWSRGERIRNAKGIDAGEQHRAKDFSDKKIAVIYPLIEWGWAREECVAAIHRANLPIPQKSACFYCPSSKKSEVLRLKTNHPALFARAVEMERAAASKLVNIKGLGRHWSWERLGQSADAQTSLFPETSEIPCMCFDGNPEEETVDDPTQRPISQ